MLRVDGAYLYEASRHIDRILSMPEEDCTRFDVWLKLNPAKEAIRQFVFESIFTAGFHVVQNSAGNLLKSMDAISADLENTENYKQVIHAWRIAALKNDCRQFEAILKAELQSLALYFVMPKGGFDNKNLIDDGAQLFPLSTGSKAPEAVVDVLTGARCLAFELWTAMGFHFHRANEAVLRRYYLSVIGQNKQPKILTMGTMISSLGQHDLGDANIRAALNNITVFHRNPLAHPDHNISNADEAIALYAAIRAAIGYMLEKLPDAEPLLPAIDVAEIVPPVVEVQ
jgi:hypothetical protein